VLRGLVRLFLTRVACSRPDRVGNRDDGRRSGFVDVGSLLTPFIGMRVCIGSLFIIIGYGAEFRYGARLA
jgi:hypothetical protein